MVCLSGHIGNRTRYLTASNAVSQLPALAITVTFCNISSFFTRTVKMQVLVTTKCKWFISVRNLRNTTNHYI